MRKTRKAMGYALTACFWAALCAVFLPDKAAIPAVILIGVELIGGYIKLIFSSAQSSPHGRKSTSEHVPRLEVVVTHESPPSRESAAAITEVIIADGLNTRALIDYRDANGHRHQRLIEVRRVVGEQEGQRPVTPVYFDAYCHMRHAPRTFRLDRIMGAFDPATGEELTEMAGCRLTPPQAAKPKATRRRH